MSEANRIKQIPPCYGEAFEESFQFTETFNEFCSNESKPKENKLYENFIKVPFVKENMIKSKFSTSKGNLGDSPLPSTEGEPTPRSFQKWGWLESDFGKADSFSKQTPRTPAAKKAKKILLIVDKPRDIGVLPIDGDDQEIYSTKKGTNIYSFLGNQAQYVKDRPAPTYIKHLEYEEAMKHQAYHPMEDLEEDIEKKRLKCINEETNKNNKSLISYLIKQAARKFFGGGSVSLPAYAFDPASNVSEFMNYFRTAPQFLKKAQLIDPDVDAYERIKLITAWGVSSLHQNISFKRAFNPVLGETYEGYMVVDDNTPVPVQRINTDFGSPTNYQRKRTSMMLTKSQPTGLRNKFINIYVEQTSHHPAITNFLIEHQDGLFKIWGYYEEVFNRGSSSHELRTKGPTYIQFKDNDKYLLTWPPKKLEGDVYMKYDEYLLIEQIDSDLKSVVFFGNEKLEGLAIEGLVYNAKNDKKFNSKARTVDDLKDIEEKISTIEGSWTDMCIIDDKTYWSMQEHKAIPNIPVPNPLPSDSRYREDLIWIWKGTNQDYAQNWKNALEDAQRSDAKLRKK